MTKTTSVLFPIMISLIGGFISIILLLQHYSHTHDIALVSMLCGGDTAGGCGAVSKSEYASFLGLPVASYGILFYFATALLLGLASLGDQSLRELAASMVFYGAAAALAIDVVLFGIQLFAIAAFCNLCLSTYAITLLLLWLLRGSRKSGGRAALAATMRRTDGKIMTTSWSFGTLLLLLAVVSANLALTYQDPARMEEHMTESTYREFQDAPKVALNTSGAAMRGNPKAELEIVLFSDFLCPWCRQLASALGQHFTKWEDRAVMYFINFPLDKFCNGAIDKTIHPGSCWATLGGICAQEQEKFWEFHDQIFQSPPKNPNPSAILRIAAQAGLDTSRLDACMRLGEMQQRVRQQVAIGKGLGITSTPRVYVNGRRVPKLSYLNLILKQEANRLGIAPLEGLDE